MGDDAVRNLVKISGVPIPMVDPLSVGDHRSAVGSSGIQSWQVQERSSCRLLFLHDFKILTLSSRNNSRLQAAKSRISVKARRSPCHHAHECDHIGGPYPFDPKFATGAHDTEKEPYLKSPSLSSTLVPQRISYAHGKSLPKRPGPNVSGHSCFWFVLSWWCDRTIQAVSRELTCLGRR